VVSRASPGNNDFGAGALAAVRARLEETGWSPRLMSPEEFAAFTRSEKDRWGGIIRRANIKLE
jgi:tripartite-type tricarboxylate transporter receptor subunit TctC